MKSTRFSITLVIIIGSLLIASSLSCGFAQVSTEISGPINSNTTWTKTGGPYIFVGPVTVSSGVTLTIQPGASILLGNYYLLVNGTLRAQGTAADPINIQNGTGSTDSRGNPIYPITFTPFSTSWSETLGTGSILENAVLRSTAIYITASPKINNNVFDNSFIGVSNFTLIAEHPALASPTISNNTLNGINVLSGIISFNSIGNITNNKISGYTTGIELHSDAGTNVQNNLILGNTIGIQLITQKGPVLAIIRNNTITSNIIGISLANLGTSTMNPTIQYNNIYANTNYSINCTVPSNINAVNNWWGTTVTLTINQSIWDSKNNPSAGNVTFVPFLNAANPAAPSTQPSPTPTLSPTPTIPPTSTPPSTINPTPTASAIPTPTIAPTSTGTSTISPTTTVQPTNPPSTVPTKTPTISPTETPQPTPSPSPNTNGNQTFPIAALVAGIIAVIIIVVAAVFLMTKRRK